MENKNEFDKLQLAAIASILIIGLTQSKNNENVSKKQTFIDKVFDDGIDAETFFEFYNLYKAIEMIDLPLRITLDKFIHFGKKIEFDHDYSNDAMGKLNIAIEFETNKICSQDYTIWLQNENKKDSLFMKQKYLIYKQLISIEELEMLGKLRKIRNEVYHGPEPEFNEPEKIKIIGACIKIFIKLYRFQHN